MSICLEGGYRCLYGCVCRSVWEGVCMSVGMSESMTVFLNGCVSMIMAMYVCLSVSVFD